MNVLDLAQRRHSPVRFLAKLWLGKTSRQPLKPPV